MQSILWPLIFILFLGCTTTSSLDPPEDDDRRGDSGRGDTRLQDTSPAPDTSWTDTALDSSIDTIAHDSGSDSGCNAAGSCTSEGNLCDGDTIVRCAMNAEGCLVEIHVGCDLGRVCSPATTTCEVPGVCGDNQTAPNEACDDGNVMAGDGCTTSCDIESGWTCQGSPSVCTEIDTSRCGDGTVDEGEPCDDGNVMAGDGCTTSCAIESGWSCTGSPSNCTEDVVPQCGDGHIDEGEACDDSNTASADGCSPLCVIDPDWTCTGEPSSCNQDLNPGCGNGTVEGDEECDDGGTNGGCSDECLTEGGVDCEHISGNLSCLSGRITRASDQDSHTYIGYEDGCGSDVHYSYYGFEGIYIFRTPQERDVTITFGLLNGDTDDWDLFVLRPSSSMACDTSMTCPAYSISATAHEEVTFHAQAGARYVIITDGRTGFDVEYELSVTCN